MLTEENIPFLKRTLYDMDALTEDENVEAKKFYLLIWSTIKLTPFK